MLFTEGKDREYEHMMMEKPGFKRTKRDLFFPTAKQRDCPHCLYFADKEKKCSLAKCAVFND